MAQTLLAPRVGAKGIGLCDVAITDLTGEPSPRRFSNTQLQTL